MANVSLCTVCIILIVFTLHKPEALCLNIDRSLCLETIVKFMHDQQKCHFNYTHANGLLKDGVILIVLYKPEALCLNIDRSLCLETIIKFMHDQHKCGFNYEHANVLLKDYNVRCQTKCQVTINNIDTYEKNSLKKVELGFGYEIYEYEPCRSTNMYMYTRALNMNITCRAWNKVKVPIGGYCTQDEQCHGSEKSGVCKLERCVCKTGYILSNFECHEGNLNLNQPCSFTEQCLGSPYASCLGGICSCIEGFMAEESNYCVPDSILIVIYQAAAAHYHIQKNLCLETAVVFMYGRKKCDFYKRDAQDSLENEETNCQTKCKVKLEGINDDDNTLWSVDISFGSVSYFINTCPNNNNHNMLTMFINCSKWNAVNVPFGGYCELNEQCQGSEHAVVCELGRCVCRPGYVISHLECHEDSKFTSASSLQRNQEETNVGATLEALFSGLLLGVVLTTVAVMINYWRSKQHANKREEPNVTFAENESTAKIVDHQQNAKLNIQRKKYLHTRALKKNQNKTIRLVKQGTGRHQMTFTIIYTSKLNGMMQITMITHAQILLTSEI